MPRKKLIRSNSYPYHVTARSNNKEWFYIPIEDVWNYSNELLTTGKKKFNIHVEAFVLMNNHYHLCVKTPDANIDKFMQFFNQNLGKKISRQADRINRIFGAPYKWNLITTEYYYNNVIRYIYQNPIRAELVDRCEKYPFSDLHTKKPTHDFLNWINKRVVQDDDVAMRKKLKKYIL